MSLHALATDMASKGRNGDSMLVHMTPGEVAGLHALALKHGGELTINPDTGLPEANFLKSLLPMLAGAALNFFVPGLGAAVGGAFGLGAAAGTGIAVGGLTTLATGSLSRGLMAGMGAYGGAGLSEGLMGAATTGDAFQTAQSNLGPDANAMSVRDVAATAKINPVTTGFEALGTEQGRAAALNSMGGAGNAFKYAAGAAAPIMADMMVPTTTKMPDAQNPGYIRQKVFDPGSQTYRDLTPVKANEFKDRSFSDIYRGYNGGGIVALAAGGAGTDAVAGAATPPAITSVEDLYKNILGREGEAEGLAFWKQGFGDTIDANEIASFKQAAQAEIAKRPAAEQQQLAPNLVAANNAALTANTGTTGGGVTNLATTGNAAATADTSGIATLNNAGATTGAATSLADAQSMVNNMYRNVLGRDADPAGLQFWSSAIASGRSPESIYQDFLTSARANTELVTADQIKNATFEDATKAYTGYMSKDTTNIVDDWVRNTLGREPTDADRQQQWYKDAFTKMLTQGQAKGLYDQFQTYAGAEATKTIADRKAAIFAELRAKGLTEADLVAQTKKTVDQLANEGIDLGRNLIGASQLTPAGGRTAYDLKAKLADLKSTASTFNTTNPYGNNTGNALTSTPGDLTRNADGTITVQPNIPGRPAGGFPGMASVRDAYTAGGGSLGYTSYAPKTAEEHEALYNKQTGDSEAAYNYLMGKGAYPTKSRVGEIARPYREATMGYPTSTNKAYNYDAATGKMVRNPDYVAPGRDAEGNVNYSMSLNEIKKYLSDTPLSGQALFDWAQENGASAQDIADATGRKLSEVYAEFRAAAKKAADAKKAAGTDASASGLYDGSGGGGDNGDGGGGGGGGGNTGSGTGTGAGDSAAGGTGATAGTASAKGGLLRRSYAMGGYAVGGGLGSLGSYSDGGRLLKGPGDGVSDSIPATIGRKQQPARLADGEFVVPARIVSELGNGSTEAGAKKLYAMMDRVQRARGKTTGKNKVAANSRADKYLPA
jgi:hypothetical protein